jgi:hypothetical protein
MTTPRLEIYFDDSDNLCIAKVERIGATSRLILDIELNDIKALDPKDASYRIGGTVLNILRIWHKEKLGAWKVPGISDESA